MSSITLEIPHGSLTCHCTTSNHPNRGSRLNRPPLPFPLARAFSSPSLDLLPHLLHVFYKTRTGVRVPEALEKEGNINR
jgi:hypothetical protein